MHKLRINISVNPKIMINSQEVCFDIQDSVHKLVAKTYLFLARKIIYADPVEMEKYFYKKIYNITLYNFWLRS
jgi:hypothetical protein